MPRCSSAKLPRIMQVFRLCSPLPHPLLRQQLIARFFLPISWRPALPPPPARHTPPRQLPTTPCTMHTLLPATMQLPDNLMCTSGPTNTNHTRPCQDRLSPCIATAPLSSATRRPLVPAATPQPAAHVFQRSINFHHIHTANHTTHHPRMLAARSAPLQTH